MKLQKKQLKSKIFAGAFVIAVIVMVVGAYSLRKGVSWENDWSGQVRLVGGSSLYDKAVDLKWTNTGIEFQFEGTEVWAEMSSACVEESDDEALVGIFVDDMSTVYQTVVVSGKSRKYLLASELSDEPHMIRISKLSEYRDSEVYIENVGIKGSKLQPTDAKEKSILFIGDSITAGYGVMAASADAPYRVSEEDGSKTYAYIVANQLQ